MPLNLTTSDGEFTPYLKYNAKAGRFYIRPEGAQQDYEVINPRLAFDMANIKTGWLFYQEGIGPEKVWDPSPSQMAARPAGPRKFKRGFEVMVYGNDQLPGIGPLGLREFSSTAANVITSILRMHADYETGLTQNPGSVPFYGCSGVNPISGAYGTNYEPQFKLIGWIERSKIPAFDEHRADQTSQAPPATNAYAAAKNGDTAFVPNAANRAPQYDERNPPPYSGGAAEFDDKIPFGPEWR